VGVVGLGVGVGAGVGARVGVGVGDGVTVGLGVCVGRDVAVGVEMLDVGDAVRAATGVLGGVGAVAPMRANRPKTTATSPVTSTFVRRRQPGLRVHIAQRPNGKKTMRVRMTNQLC
jgi:hypothetical protein